jgi:hypothetical protein
MNGTLILHNQKTGSKNIMKFLLRKSYWKCSSAFRIARIQTGSNQPQDKSVFAKFLEQPRIEGASIAFVGILIGLFCQLDGDTIATTVCKE